MSYLRGRISLLRPSNEEGRHCNEVQNNLALLRRYKGESLIQLLQSLDLAVGEAFVGYQFTDETNPSE